MNCELEPFGGCEGTLQHHHIIPKAALQKADAAKKFVEKEDAVLMAWVCARHHDKLSGFAHTKQGKAFLVYGKCTLLSTEYVAGVIDDLRGMFKGPRPELGLEAILHSGSMK